MYEILQIYLQCTYLVLRLLNIRAYKCRMKLVVNICSAYFEATEQFAHLIASKRNKYLGRFNQSFMYIGCQELQ